MVLIQWPEAAGIQDPEGNGKKNNYGEKMHDLLKAQAGPYADILQGHLENKRLRV